VLQGRTRPQRSTVETQLPYGSIGASAAAAGNNDGVDDDRILTAVRKRSWRETMRAFARDCGYASRPWWNADIIRYRYI